jgi:hypothetical protein
VQPEFPDLSTDDAVAAPKDAAIVRDRDPILGGSKPTSLWSRAEEMPLLCGVIRREDTSRA